MVLLMKIAITGASGFLGRYLVNALLTRKCDITCFSRNKGNLTKHFGMQSPVHCVETDYSLDSLSPHFIAFDACIHLAAKRPTAKSPRLTDFIENIIITDNLLTVCEEVDVGRVVLISSMSVYSPEENKLPFLETEMPSSKNSYGLSKWISERITDYYPLQTVILRMGQLVGWGERSGYMLMSFLTQALKGEPLIVFGKGSGKRDYLYVKDAIKAILTVLDTTAVNGTYNIGSGRSVSHLELAQTIAGVFHEAGANVSLDSSREEDSSISFMDITRAGRLLNWAPRYDLSQMLRDMKENVEAFEHWGND